MFFICGVGVLRLNDSLNRAPVKNASICALKDFVWAFILKWLSFLETDFINKVFGPVTDEDHNKEIVFMEMSIPK